MKILTVSEAYKISNRARVVAAIPIAGPLTIAIKSFGYKINASTNSLCK